MPPLDERVVPVDTVSVVPAPERVRVSLPLIVSVLIWVLALSVGDLVVVPIVTVSLVPGLPPGVQLVEVPQSVLVLPFQIKSVPAKVPA